MVSRHGDAAALAHFLLPVGNAQGQRHAAAPVRGLFVPVVKNNSEAVARKDLVVFAVLFALIEDFAELAAVGPPAEAGVVGVSFLILVFIVVIVVVHVAV